MCTEIHSIFDAYLEIKNENDEINNLSCAN